jgi:CubicO group peptidase (beta-lactamase class C family)
MADREAGIKADTDTLYYIASSTKSFTALTAAMLDQEGKIKLSDPVTKYTPGVRFKSEIPDKITIRDLLTHTSGLRNLPLQNRLAFTGQIDQREIDHVFAEGTSFNEANFGKYNYTNLGYNIYGLALHYQLNKKWQDLLQERIFGPAGLAHTTAYVSKARARKYKIAAPYVIDTDAAEAGKMVRSQLEKTDENMQSAGGIFMSISDLGRWLTNRTKANSAGNRWCRPSHSHGANRIHHQHGKPAVFGRRIRARLADRQVPPRQSDLSPWWLSGLSQPCLVHAGKKDRGQRAGE